VTTDSTRRVFTRGALKEIVKQAKGYPRIINILCDNALITGFGYKKKPVSKKIVNEIMADLEGRRRPFHFKLAFACLMGFLLVGVLYFASPSRDMLSLAMKEMNLSLSPLSETASSEGKILSIQNATIHEPVQTTTEEEDPLPPASPTVYDEIEPPPPSPERKTETEQFPIPAKAISPVVPLPVKTFSPAETSFPATRIAKRGDTLATLTLEVYGFTNVGLIHWVRQHNPFITDVNTIQTGHRIVFPEPLDSEKRGKHGPSRRTKSS
jgi:general secretion pathway protein A